MLTADGQKISFELELSMSRSYVEDSSTRIAFGQPERKVDPLVLNFSGNAASLINQRFSFDLDADGSAENIASLRRTIPDEFCTRKPACTLKFSSKR